MDYRQVRIPTGHCEHEDQLIRSPRGAANPITGTLVLVSAVVAAVLVAFLLGLPSELLPGPSRHTAPLVLPEGATPLPFFSSAPTRVPAATTAPSAEPPPLPTADVAFKVPALPDQNTAVQRPVTPRPQATEAPAVQPLPVGTQTPQPRATPIPPSDAAKNPAPIDPTKSPAPAPTDPVKDPPRPTPPPGPTPSRPPTPTPTPTHAVSPCADERAPHEAKKVDAADEGRCDDGQVQDLREKTPSKPQADKPGRPRHD